MKVSVFIGRFQPFTLSHKKIIIEAMKRSEKVVIVIGSDNEAYTIVNPFSAKEREDMIKKDFNNLDFIYLEDSNYDLKEWKYNLNNKLSKYGNDLEFIGHKKDNTSFYTELFSSFYDVGNLMSGLSATDIRTAMFEDNIESVSDLVPANTFSSLLDFMKTNRYKRLREEYFFIKKYKEDWKKAPYPPIFVTGDSLVINNNSILLIERKNLPGKGLYALPGGFLNQEETIEDCSIRELKEETTISLSDEELKKSIIKERLFDSPFRSLRGRIITKVFVYDLKDKEVSIKPRDDASKAFWFPIDKIHDIKSNFFSDHYKMIKSLID